MSRVLITLALACLSLKSQQQAQTFAMNINTATIAELNSLGIPTVPFPQIRAFIAGNLTDKEDTQHRPVG